MMSGFGEYARVVTGITDHRRNGQSDQDNP